MNYYAWGGGYIGTMGGFRALFEAFIGNFELAKEHYEQEGTKICYMKGKIRYPDGNLEEGKWLIVGTEGETGLAVYDENKKRILHIPKDGKFLRARLKPTEEKWQTLTLSSPSNIKEGNVFYRAGKKWHTGKEGDTVLGYLIYQGECTLENISIRQF